MSSPRHLHWTRAGRKLDLGGRQRAYKACVGQRNIELPDGSFAPYVWDEAAACLRFYERVEARFVQTGVEWLVDGKRVARTKFAVEERIGDRWFRKHGSYKIEKLPDEDDLGPIASARIALSFRSAAVEARHIIVAGGRYKARGDTHVVAHQAGEYRVVLEHDLGVAQHVKTSCNEGYITPAGWRVAWTAEESKTRHTSYDGRFLRIELESVRKRRRARQPAELFVSPDTYGSVSVLAGDDDSQSSTTNFFPDPLSGFSPPFQHNFYVDDGDGVNGDINIHLWFGSVDLEGLPASIDAGTILTLARDTTDGGNAGGKVIRFRCQASNTPVTGAAGASGETGRPYQRTYNSAFSNHTFPGADTSTQTPSIQTAVQGLRDAGYSYTGSATHAIMVTGGGLDQWGITSVDYAALGHDLVHATGAEAAMTIVFTLGDEVQGAGNIASAQAVGAPSLSGGEDPALGRIRERLFWDQATRDLGGVPEAFSLVALYGSIASREAFGSHTISAAAGNNISGAGNIATGYASGTAKLNRSISTTGIATGYASGSQRLVLYVVPGGIATGYASGTQQLNRHIATTGIAAGYAAGSTTLQPGAVTASPTGIATAYASGSQRLVHVVAPSGIASGYATGATKLSLLVLPTGIATAYASGSQRLVLYLVTSAIGPGYASGTHTLSVGAATASPSSIASAYASGSHTATPGVRVTSPSAIGPAYASGTAALTSGAAPINPSGIASGQAIGALVATNGVTIQTTGIATGFTSGSHTLSPGPVTISATAIASAQAFGNARLVLYLVVSGIASAQTVGAARLNLTIATTGTATSYASGAQRLNTLIAPQAIAPAFAAGNTRLVLVVAPSGIPTGYAAGPTTLAFPPQSVSPSAIGSGFVSGSATLSVGAVVLHPTGIASSYASGTTSCFTGGLIRPSSIASNGTFGLIRVAAWPFPFVYSGEPIIPGPVTPTGVLE